MKIFRTKKAIGFTLVEIMIVVLIIGILLAIAIPNFVGAREASRAKACIGNLKQIDSATQQWCMDKKISAGTYSTGPSIATDLVTTNGTGYIRVTPVCPSGGTEAVATTIVAVPSCNIPGQNASDTNYQSAGGVVGKYYHGM